MATTVVFGPIYPPAPYDTDREVPRNMVAGVMMAPLPLSNLILLEDGTTPFLLEDGMTFLLLE
jgi:hypothetical protein